MLDAVVESSQVVGNDMRGGVQFPSGRGVVDEGSGSGKEGFVMPPASIVLPQQLFDGDLGTPIGVANILLMNADQLFPTSK